MGKQAIQKKPSSSSKVVKKNITKKPAAWLPKRGMKRVYKRPSRAGERAGNPSYTRSTSKPSGFRKESLKPKRTMMDFMQLGATRPTYRTLKNDGMVKRINITDKCETCGAKLTKDMYNSDLEMWSYRCSSRSCRKRVCLMANHPFFISEGDKGIDIGMQVWLLMHFLHKVPSRATHLVTGLHHNTVICSVFF